MVEAPQGMAGRPPPGLAAAPPAIDERSLQVGLLMESAQAHQALATTHLERLRAHTRDIDGVVRDEIRRTLLEELQALTAEVERAGRALGSLRRAANRHALMGQLAMALLCSALPLGLAHWVLPSAGELTALRAQREVLTANIGRLERRGARVDWRTCGPARKLCVRVDEGSPAYGEHGDYRVAAELAP